MTLVIDASVLVPACTVVDGFAPFGDEPLVGPPLLWPEARSVLHRSVWRNVVSRDTGLRALARLESAPVMPEDHRQLGREAWRLADELGWAKTYDAEYLALATILDCPLLTKDTRLGRAAARLGINTSVT